MKTTVDFTSLLDFRSKFYCASSVTEQKWSIKLYGYVSISCSVFMTLVPNQYPQIHVQILIDPPHKMSLMTCVALQCMLIYAINWHQNRLIISYCVTNYIDLHDLILDFCTEIYEA